MTVEFYDSHPGFGGAAIPLPRAVKKIADKLSGQKLSLTEAVKRIQAVTDGIVRAIAEYKFISLEIKTRDGRIHYFRVIKYK